MAWSPVPSNLLAWKVAQGPSCKLSRGQAKRRVVHVPLQHCMETVESPHHTRVQGLESVPKSGNIWSLHKDVQGCEQPSLTREQAQDGKRAVAELVKERCCSLLGGIHPSHLHLHRQRVEERQQGHGTTEGQQLEQQYSLPGFPANGLLVVSTRCLTCVRSHSWGSPEMTPGASR